VLTLGYRARWGRLRGRAEGGGGATGGGAALLGEQAQGCSSLVRCGEVVVVPSLNRRPEAVRGGYFRREAAGELARLLDVWPGFAATDDGTVRRSTCCRGGASRGGAGWRPAVVVRVADRRGRAQGGRRRGAGVVVGQAE
jgi:hypothetical protein